MSSAVLSGLALLVECESARENGDEKEYFRFQKPWREEFPFLTSTRKGKKSRGGAVKYATFIFLSITWGGGAGGRTASIPGERLMNAGQCCVCVHRL